MKYCGKLSSIVLIGFVAVILTSCDTSDRDVFDVDMVSQIKRSVIFSYQ